MQQRSNQPFQGQAQARQVQQSPILSNSQSNQQQYSVQNTYAHPSNVQSPYLSSPGHFTQQNQHHSSQDNPYYTADPSPRSSNGATYYTSEKPEHMAAATMQRPYPPMYHTPQSNSPASVTSPQTHDHGRPMFSQQPSQITQPMYPYAYSGLSQMPTAYGSHGQSSMTPTQMMPGSYNSSQVPHSQVSSHTPTLNTSPRLKSEPSQSFAQTPQQRTSMMTQQHPTPGPTPGSTTVPPSQTPTTNTGSNAAPGPIPATTPLVVRQDNNGVQWIAFEYSRDRVKMEYTIRCDVESVDTSSLAQEFKSENCVYPRACVPRDQYKGNRLNYESDCNQVGWALAELNPCLRGKRGLIQRAVDSWRNSNQDPRLRSRRVRRQAKINTKNRGSAAGPPQTSGPVSAGLPGPTSMPAPSSRGPVTLPSTNSQVHHHHVQHDISPTAQDPSVGGYSAPQPLHRPGSTSQHLASPNELRHAQSYPGYQPYPTVATSLGPSMAPPMPGNMHQFGRPGGNAAMASKEQQVKVERNSGLFGDLPEGKKRKFILVDDTQKNTRVRVKVTLDQVDVSEIPDSYRKQNSVFPRSFYPVQMETEPPAGRFITEDLAEPDDGPPTVGRMTIPCTVTDGDVEMEVSQLTRGKRDRERKINELGYRMAWGQSRVFSNRPMFLARALDAYRMKQRTALIGAGQEASSIPPHLEVRPGKRRWLERTRPIQQPNTPPQKVSDEES